MKILKVYSGFSEGGYRENKYKIYSNMKTLAEDFGTEDHEIYYHVADILPDQLQNMVEEIKKQKKENQLEKEELETLNALKELEKKSKELEEKLKVIQTKKGELTK